MDYEDMEQKLRAHDIHTALFCSPHNPTGRIWERWELERMMELFRRYDVRVISDEIWSDLTLFGHQHIPLPSISQDAGERTVAFYSPSKTFNLAGLVGSYHIIYNKELRDELRRYSALCHYNDMNVLSMRALMGAYTPEGRRWMEALKAVLEQNVNYACDFISTRLDGVSAIRPQGTYILMIDCEEWRRTHDRSLDEVLKAGVGVGVIWRDGRAFHAPWGIRMNLALPHNKPAEVFERLERYVFMYKYQQPQCQRRTSVHPAGCTRVLRSLKRTNLRTSGHFSPLALRTRGVLLAPLRGYPSSADAAG